MAWTTPASCSSARRRGRTASISFGYRGYHDDRWIAAGQLLVTDDIEAAGAELVERGVPVSEVFHGAAGRFHAEEPSVRLLGPDSYGQRYRSHAVFGDPDGDGWVLREVTQRLPGRLRGRRLAADPSRDLSRTPCLVIPKSCQAL